MEVVSAEAVTMPGLLRREPEWDVTLRSKAGRLTLRLTSPEPQPRIGQFVAISFQPVSLNSEPANEHHFPH